MIKRVLESSVPWRVGAVLASALLVGIAAFWLTSMTPPSTHIGPACLTGIVREAGFDPWSGEPYGTIYRCANGLPGLGDGGSHEVTADPPPELAGRQAISIPIGTAVGLIVLGSVGLGLGRRGRAAGRGGAPSSAGRGIPDSR